MVVDFHSNLLSSAPRSSLPYWADLLDLRKALDLWRETGDTETFAAIAALRLVPSVKDRRAIRSEIVAAFRGEESEDRRLCRALDRNLGQNRGARPSPVKPPPTNPEAYFATGPSHGRWKPNRANVAYMNRLFRLASDSGITVFWLLPPSSPAWRTRRAAIGADEPLTRLARQMHARHPNLVVVDGRARATSRRPSATSPTCTPRAPRR